MTERVLELKGLDELLRDYEKVRDQADPMLSGTMEEGLLLLEGDLKDYPPQPPRDRAKHFNTYVRGIGRMPKSAFVGGEYDAKALRKANRVLKKQGKAPRTVVKMTSQKLGTRWTHKITVRKEFILGSLGNSATYADAVQGDRQTAFHKQTGWPSVDDVVDNKEEVILDMFQRDVDILLDTLDRVRRYSGNTTNL